MNIDSQMPESEIPSLQAMSTEELREILRRDMDSDRDESDMDLILRVMEELEKREKTETTEDDTEASLNKLRELIARREEMFAETEIEEGVETQPKKSGQIRPLWHRLAGIAAVIVLVISIGFSAARASGYDLWGGIVHWTETSLYFGEKDRAFSPDMTYQGLQSVLEQNGVTIPVLPHWLPEPYIFDDIQTFDTPKTTQISARGIFQNKMMSVEVEVIKDDEVPIARIYEKDEEPVRQVEYAGITHYIMKNTDSTVIVWVRENKQIALCFAGSEIDAEKIIESIYMK